MQLRMWMLDVAREQSPTLDHLRRYLDLTQESGFNAIGLYLEHRFAYPSTPWSHGQGCLTPEMVRQMQEEYPDLQIVPFINLLGHFEGMLYTEYGKRFREETFKGLQACPCHPGFVELCHQIIEDTVSVFSSDLIHIGGDETQQLGVCPTCQAKVVAWTSRSGSLVQATNPDAEVQATDGKALLYGEHFGPLARKVQELGRRPALWGDMFLEHPEALDFIPKEALIFDWQYFKSPLETSRQFTAKGFEVVCSPALLTYNALWCHLSESGQNVRDHAEAARELNAYGVCVTTWECGLMGNYETLFPAIRGCGEMLSANQGEDKTPVERLRIDPTAQLPDSPSDSSSVTDAAVIAACDSIFTYAIRGRTRVIEIQRRGGSYHVAYDGNPVAEYRLGAGERVVRRLARLSNLNVAIPMDGQQGRISGVFETSSVGETRFEYTVEAEGGVTPNRMVFTSTSQGTVLSEGFSSTPANDTEEKRMRMAQFRFDPTDQLPESPSDDISIVVAVCDSIFMNAIHARTRVIEIDRRGDSYRLAYDGKRVAELPFEQGEGIVRRLAMLSNLNIMRPMDGQPGQISGAFTMSPGGDSSTFSFATEAFGGPTPIAMRFTSSTDPTPTPSDKPQTTGHTFADSYAQESLAHEEWARLMSDDLAALGGIFACGQIRSSLKCRLLLYSNPFLAWMHHHEELSGEVGDRALAILAHAITVAPTTSMRGVAEFGKLAIEFVRYAEESRQAYAQGQPGVAAAALVPCRPIFEQLERIAIATNRNIGGSRADIERCRVAKEHVERVIRRIKEYGDGSLGYLPAFEILTHPKFMPHDQASWWLINRWANE